MSSPDAIRAKLILPLAGLVALAWFASLIDSFITGSFTALTYTTPSFFALAGYVFGFQIVKGATKHEE